MHMKILSAAAALALLASVPAGAQLKAPDKAAAAPAAKIDVPTGIFYKDLGPTQYLIKSRLIGQPVVDKAGVKVAVVDDVVLGTKDDKIDGLILDAGGKKLGIRMTETKIESKDGKITISLPRVTAEMIKVLPAYGSKK